MKTQDLIVGFACALAAGWLWREGYTIPAVLCLMVTFGLALEELVRNIKDRDEDQ